MDPYYRSQKFEVLSEKSLIMFAVPALGRFVLNPNVIHQWVRVIYTCPPTFQFSNPTPPFSPSPVNIGALHFVCFCH